jgi:hypothetical protein
MKKFTLSLLVALSSSLFTIGKAQTITTVAGDGTASFSGDGGQATAAGMSYPWGTKVDAAGNIFISLIYDDRIRKVNTSGIISTVAGNGTTGFSGNGGPATAAQFQYCHGIALDNSGNILEGDGNNQEIRIIDSTTHIINDFAGNNVAGNSGDGGPATAAEILDPYTVAVDGSNNVYVSSYSDCIRKVNTSGIISTFAGNGSNGYTGDGGPATAAEMGITFGMIADNNGNLYFQDSQFFTIRKINTSGIVTTIAGIPSMHGFSGDGGPATAAEMYPNYGGIAVDAFGDVFIADYNNNRVREITAAGIINTVVGNGTAGFSGDGGAATAAELNGPNDVSLDAAGNLYVTDANNNRIRKVTGLVTGITQIESVHPQWSVYPNPGNGVFNIVASGQGSATGENRIEVYNMLGEQVYSGMLKPLNASVVTNRVDLGSVPAGVYLYRITDSDKSVLKQGKIVITK